MTTKSVPKKREDVNPSLIPDDFNLTELGMAERLVDKFGSIFRYCPDRSGFLVWTGTHWKLDRDRLHMKDLAQMTVRALYKTASEETETNRRKALGEFEVPGSCYAG